MEPCIFDKVQPYVTSEDGELFDVSFNTDDVSYVIIELTHDEIVELISSIKDQVTLLQESYQNHEDLGHQDHPDFRRERQ